MTDALIFSDVHASPADPRGLARLLAFLSDVCPRARRVYILGDLFDFWFGPKQAALEPYSTILRAIAALAGGGVEVTFFHGNRDFYVDSALARTYRFRLVPDCAVETICDRRVLLCHGDLLCTNDVRYHSMRAILSHPFAQAVLTRLPSALALALARAFRRRSIRSVASKSQWVLGINDRALAEYFARGADVIICGHTHQECLRTVPTPDGDRLLYTLGDFGLSGSYIECDSSGFSFRAAPV